MRNEDLYKEITAELKEKGSYNIPNICTFQLVPARKGKYFDIQERKLKENPSQKRLKVRIMPQLHKWVKGLK